MKRSHEAIPFIPLSEGSDGEDPVKAQATSYQKNQGRYRRWHLVAWIQSILIVLLLLICFYLSWRAPSDLTCSRVVSPYSPLFDVPDLIKYEEYDLPLFFNEPSPFRGPPNPEREKLWEDAWHMPMIGVPADKLPAMNKSRSGLDYKHVPTEAGDGYIAQVEVFHQLHCVHMLRQWAYKEYWTDQDLPLPGGMSPDSQLARMHLDHCIEVLRVNIMCTSDVTPILIELDPKAPFGERADFRSNHKCRNFWDIHKYVTENAVTA
ncbi:oxidase ustYa family protein [Aspergillus brunneoviolaceus CBS 621.78]|uniref:Uncharacterized protein n=1 Tax=Aspergillus brunneoviolaceus CBS 621.78 TaxID=1450534 RepID=A0ACD1GIM1_9EURO|nr:hypothetical protein BO95DRAFT_439452 [Aspergillus brunneoviolaceus CBS 621.78]RAH49185.1 hypothetical protein BO95DRAFT_439452 [Aspergillus brunneoviolaceus CBS 621.78]